MSRRVKLLGGPAVVILVAMAGAACGDHPAGVSIDPATASAAYDGAHTFGSGNWGETTTGGGDSGSATTQSDTTHRGGVLIGSGH